MPQRPYIFNRKHETVSRHRREMGEYNINETAIPLSSRQQYQQTNFLTRDNWCHHISED